MTPPNCGVGSYDTEIVSAGLLRRTQPFAATVRSIGMQYLAYFAIATPVLLVWLFWAAETSEPPKPISLLRSASHVLRQDDAMTQRGQNTYYPQFPRNPETTALAISSGAQKTALASQPPSKAQPAPKLLTKIKREVRTARAEGQPGDAREGQLVEYQQPFGQDRFSIH
jgi:hypothetical protein